MILVESLEQLRIDLQTVIAANLEQGPSWMDPYIAFFQTDLYRRTGRKLRRCGGWEPIFGYLITKNYTDARSGDLTCCTYLPAKTSGYYSTFMRGSMAFIQGEDPSPTEPRFRGFGGQICKGKR